MRAASRLAVSLVALALGGPGCDGKKSTESPDDGAASTDAAGEDGLPWVDRGNGCMSVHTSAEAASTDRDVQMISSGNQAAIAFVPGAADMLVECGADEVTVSSESEMYTLSFTVITGDSGAPETADAIDMAMHMQFSAEPWSAQEIKDVAAEVAGFVDGFTFAPDQIWGENWQQQAAP